MRKLLSLFLISTLALGFAVRGQEEGGGATTEPRAAAAPQGESAEEGDWQKSVDEFFKGCLDDLAELLPLLQHRALARGTLGRRRRPTTAGRASW